MKGPKDTMGRSLRDLRISVTDQCNFRCGYCMPSEVFGPNYAFLKGAQLLSFEEIARLARLFSTIGVHKLRLTGGEPLLRHDLATLVEMLSAIEGIDDIALTTNGILLLRYAGLLECAGLNRVTVSLDALDDAIFQKMNGRNVPVQRVVDGIEAAAEAGMPVKINMVVQKGVNDSEILPMARFFRERGHILRFIEYMDVGNHIGWSMDQVYPSKQIVEEINKESPIEPLDANYPGEVAKRYRYLKGGGEIGLISSVTQPFCKACSRARLSADGMLYTCLFANSGWDLKEMLREGETDEVILKTLFEIWSNRSDQYSDQRNQILKQHLHRLKVEMSYIGG